MRRVVLVAALLAAGVLAPAAVAQEGEPAETGVGIGLVEVPAGAQDDPRARTYVVDHVQPGTSFERRVRIENGTDRPMAPTLYVAPATLDDGVFSIAERGAPGEVASWATLEPGRLELAPRAKGEAVLRIAVPADAPDGEYYGAALAELTADGGGGLRLANRVGIRIYLSVGDGDQPRSDFEVTRLEAARGPDGVATVTAVVQNTGERALDVGGELVLDQGPGGAEAGPFRVGSIPTLAIGGREPVVVTVGGDVAAGPWRARLTLRSGELERGIEATITFPEAGEAPRSAAFRELEEQKRSWGLVAAALLILVVLALLLLLERERRRRRRAAGMPPG